MKHTLIILSFLFSFHFSSAQIVDTTAKKIDQRFVGSWSGSEKDNQQKGLTKYWIQHRSADGTFIFLFTAVDKDGEVQSAAEKGKWWVEKGIFYELHFSTGKTDTYTFEVLDEEHIKFKLKSTDIEFENKEYSFVDTKMEEM